MNTPEHAMWEEFLVVHSSKVMSAKPESFLDCNWERIIDWAWDAKESLESWRSEFVNGGGCKTRYDYYNVIAEPAKADSELSMIFDGLAKNWREATGSYSLNLRRFRHPTYQVLMHTLRKEDVRDSVPHILSELRERPDMWFDALKSLTNADPAKEAKTFDEAVAAWIDWGKQEKYIS